MKSLSILVVDDEQGYRDEISEYLEDCGFIVWKAEKPSLALNIVNNNHVDIAIIDLKLPEMNGIKLLKEMLKLDPELTVIMISGHGDMDNVIEAMHAGAVDFFAKPFNLADIEYSIQRTRKFINLQQQVNSIRKTYEDLLSSRDASCRIKIIGESTKMHDVMRKIEQVAGSVNTDVLITGESGTGKELAAKAIHQLSSRKEKIFFDVNCTAIPENLFESEFFGHTRNAFTGAVSERKGWFETAHGGTLFLDEIGDMPLTMQAKLLRVLEERRIRRVGSNKDIELDLRIITSTNKNLPDLINNGSFRKDLYFRLNKFQIHLPALRDRPEDIPSLLQYYNETFCLVLRKKLKPLPPQTIRILQNYSFPGNVRELKNLVERAIISSDHDSRFLEIDLKIPAETIPPAKFPDSSSLSLQQLVEVEKDKIKKALLQTDNNKSKAAQLLEITRTSLNRRIKKYDL